ncbi:lipopolysaccharide biosynthesis protein [Arthrobacter cupressi]|uniref:Polysaccharide transporter, PST family n=1 Tax=Arthrobacter cupressi TaxID=1045773 RepID=A0A1G8IY29_9MICC|nr:lipopolysaccharide biosynthesis protein [Arthrobacter cupressi]NYD79166.1 PST family polysaccharide transporter [Arthrobacter cupressi]SDI23884.1 polysaccharide transporter, PST family [Arthrobacter cupressi]
MHRRPAAKVPAPGPPEGGTPAFSGRTAVSGVRWSLSAVLARQGFQMLCAVVLARLLGPESYGIISAATVYTTFAALFLDQGLSSALIQRPEVSRRAAGATATVNLMFAVLIGAVTVVLAPWAGSFFHAPGVTALLLPLAAAIPLKGLAITPRAMLSRELLLRQVARADIIAAAAGATAGITAALLGAGYFALAYQVITTDLLTALLLLLASRGPGPNFHLGEVRPLLAFSMSVFFTDFLAYFSRNVDNILVGRFLGVLPLSLYSMAYRIMVVPVQLVGQTVNRIMFPAFSRAAGDTAMVAGHLLSASRVVAMLAAPPMAYVACAAPELVHVVLGDAWAPAAPIVTVLAIGGIRETLFYITPSLMKGLGKGRLIVRYEVLAAMVQVGGIVVGLQFGLLGVAVGLVGFGFLLVPVLLAIQSRLSGRRVRELLGVLMPAVHSSLWGAAAYLALRVLGWSAPATAAAGLLAFIIAGAAALFLFHRKHLKLFFSQARSLFVRHNGERPAMTEEPLVKEEP